MVHHLLGCLALRDNTKACSSVSQTSSVLYIMGCARLLSHQVFKIIISPDSTFYMLYSDIYFAKVLLLATRVRTIFRKTLLKVYSNQRQHALLASPLDSLARGDQHDFLVVMGHELVSNGLNLSQRIHICVVYGLRRVILLMLSKLKTKQQQNDIREVKHDVNGRRQTAKITSDLEFFTSNP